MPELNRFIASNTTPVIALSTIGRLELLEKLYSVVFIPPAVAQEINAGGSKQAADSLKISPFIRIKPLKNPGKADRAF